MKTVNVLIEPTDDQTEDEYTLECLTTVMGPYYYSCLNNVFEILKTYDKGKSLTPDAEKVLADLREKMAVNFSGLQRTRGK